MKLLSATIPPSCEIVLHGDSHHGSANAPDDSVNALLDWIMAGPRRYFAHLGDEIEAITTDDKRYQHRAGEQPVPLRQAAAVVAQYRRAAKRGLVWLMGNHSFALHRFGNVTQDLIAAPLGIPYGQWTCKLALRDRHGQIAKLYLCHGVRESLTSNAKDYDQRVANMKAALKMRLLHKAGDCLVMAMGHTHKLLVVEPAQRLILRDDGEKLVQEYLGPGDGAADYIEPDRRWYCNTGSFLRTYALDDSGYAERAGYDPVELGYCVVRIEDRRVVEVRKVVVE